MRGVCEEAGLFVILLKRERENRELGMDRNLAWGLKRGWERRCVGLELFR